MTSSSHPDNNVQHILNLQISNWNILYVKLHNYHWYVKGPQFFTLHEKFQLLYEEAALHVDELAERLLAIGGKPLATMGDYLKTASIREASEGQSALDMVRTITADFTQLTTELKEGIEVAETADDQTTADILLAILVGLQKHIWMLNAFAGE